MLSLALALLVAQTQPAIRRSTPASDDPGMVVRQAGTVNVTCTNCQMPFTPDGGVIGAVTQGRALDGGTGWGVYIEGGTLSVFSSTSFDGGSIGFMRMPDGGPLEVYVTNSSGSSGGGWVPDGGFVGLVGLADGGGVFVTNTSLAVTGPLTDAQLRAAAVPVSASTLPLPSGAATEATLSTRVADSTITDRLNTLGQKTGAASAPVVIASDQTAIPINDNGGSITIDGTVSVSGTVTTAGTTTAAQGAPASTANRWPVQLTDGTDLAQVSAGGAVLVDGSGTTQPVSGTVAATQSGVWNVTNISGTVSLPTGAATETTLSGRLAESTFTGRFPAAAALADATANPSLTSSASYLFGFNGTTWDRLRKSASGLLVDIQNTSLAVTQSGAWSVGLTSGTNYIGRTRLTDGTLDVSLLNSAPGSDTGQVAVPVRIISSLAGGAGGTSSSFSAAFPASGTAAGFFDGTNMVGARTFDVDTGAGAQNVLGVNLRVAASGGSSEAAAGAGTTSASTLRVVLPTDQTAIPINDNGGSVTVDGTVASTQSGTWSVRAQDGAGTSLGSRASAGGTTGLAVYPIQRFTTTVQTTSVTCGTSATAAPASVLSNRYSITLVNNSSVTIYLGGSGVTTSSGIPLLPGAIFSDTAEASAYYCIVATGTANLRVLEN